MTGVYWGAVIGSLVALAVLYLLARAVYWKMQATSAIERHDDIVSEALRIQREQARAEVELAYLKGTIQELVKRPIAAVLTDQQFLALVHAIKEEMGMRMSEKVRPN